MRVMIVSTFEGPVTLAAKMAMSRGAKVTSASSTREALDLLRNGHGADILFVDLYNDIDTLIQTLKKERFSIPVIACGINADPELAARAIRSGAQDYIPFPPESEMIAAVLQAMAQSDEKMICQDEEMVRCLRLADRIAPSEANVLITGESGTGKEVMATYIHSKSKRSSGAFVSVNCAAIPENLLESELFGHEKGAFTGAIARRIGKFEEANGGTLLLDEITEMDIRLQAKLLRAIQERMIDRVGGSQPVKVDIRIIATSNRNLLEACKNGTFREDLYYRLNVVNLALPPLRHRKKDIVALSNHFVKKYCDINHLPLKKISNESFQVLENHSWEGNVRQLENTIHRSVLLSDQTTIKPEDLFDPATFETKSVDAPSNLERTLLIGRTVGAVEKDLILGTLNHCHGNKTHAATILGISIRTLRNKLKEYAQDDAVYEPSEVRV